MDSGSDMVKSVIRKNFTDTAFWKPSAVTWRATARAVTADTRVGVAKQKVIVVPRGLHETKAESWTTIDENVEQEFSFDLLDRTVNKH